MISWKNKALTNQRTHRERHQPETRKHIGILEKKNDYKLRARNFSDKQALLQLLKKRALNKNPDEFYFNMINSKMKGGLHKEKIKTKKYSKHQIKVMETQDLRYLNLKRNHETRALEKLQSRLHAIDAVNDTQNKHCFFIDDGTEIKNDLDLAKMLNTHPALLHRKSNRLQLNKLNEIKIDNVDQETLKEIEKEKLLMYSKLKEKINKEKSLIRIQEEFDIKRALKNKPFRNPDVLKKQISTSNFRRKK